MLKRMVENTPQMVINNDFKEILMTIPVNHPKNFIGFL